MTELSADRMRPFARYSHRQATAADPTAKWLAATTTRQDLIAVLCFCAAGLLLTLGVLTGLADVSAVVEQISRMP